MIKNLGKQMGRRIAKALLINTLSAKIGPSYAQLVNSLADEQRELLLTTFHEVANLLFDKATLSELTTRYAEEGKAIDVGDLASVLSFVDEMGTLDWIMDRVIPIASSAGLGSEGADRGSKPDHGAAPVIVATCPHCTSKFVVDNNNSMKIGD